MVQRTTMFTSALLFAFSFTADSQELRPGVSLAAKSEFLPTATKGFEAYLVGELHGVTENEEFELQYLAQLHKASGLRDVAIEEDSVYESEAQAFVDSELDVLPSPLCLRAGILYGIRRLNMGRNKDARIRVHLTDIDSPATAILQHLAVIKQKLKANSISIPTQAAIGAEGLQTVAQMKLLTTDPATQSQLRTIELSIVCLQQGLEVGTASFKGSPYLESREQAVVSNIADLIKSPGKHPYWLFTAPTMSPEPPGKMEGPTETNHFNPWPFVLRNPVSKPIR